MQRQILLFVAAVIAAGAALIVPIVWIGQIAWPAWMNEFAGGERGFSQNLLSESIGVAAATLVIVPLANLTGRMLERWRRRKVAHQFLQLVCAEFEQLRTEYLFLFAQDFAPAKFMMESAAVDRSLAALAQNLARIDRKTERLRRIAEPPRTGEAQPETDAEAAGEGEDAAAKAEADERYRREVYAHIKAVSAALERVDDLVEDLQSLDRVAGLYATVIEPEMIANVAKFSSEIREQLTRFRGLRRYLSGNATEKDRNSVDAAILNTGMLTTLLREILNQADARDLAASLTTPDVDTDTQKRFFAVIKRFVDEHYYGGPPKEGG